MAELMIRWVRLFVWLRLRILINTVKSGARRDALSRLSRFAEVAAPFALAAFIVPFALALGAAALAGGFWMAGHPDVEQADKLVRVLAGTALVLVFISPVASAMKGETEASVRLLLLPISSRLLFAVQLVSGIGDPAIAAVIPALFALPVGLALGGAAGSASLTAAAGTAFLAVLLALQSLANSLLQMLFRDRRRAEFFSLLLVVSMIAVGLLPQLFFDKGSPHKVEVTVPALLSTLLKAAPSELYSRVPRLSLQGDGWHALVPLAALAAVATALAALNWVLFRRLINTPESGGHRRHSHKGVRAPRFPGLSVGSSAVAWAAILNLMRTGRGRLAVFLTPLMIPFLGMVMFSQGRAPNWGDLPVDRGMILALMAVGFSLLTSQPLMFNQFGADRAGLTLQFLLPLSGVELVRGKLAASACLVTLTALGGLAGALVVAPSGHPLVWAAFPVLALYAFLMAAPAGTLLSIFFPKASKLSSWGSEGNPHPSAALLGTLLVGPALGPPLALAAIGLLWMKSLLWMWLLMLAWSPVAAGAFWGLSTLAARILDSRREALALVAQGR